jgi:hypothetical protein
MQGTGGSSIMRNLFSVVVFLIVIFSIKMSACEAADNQHELSPELTDAEILHAPPFCGAEPIMQQKGGSGDCKRHGIVASYRFEKLNGVPVRRWSILGSVSNLSIATGCYCVVDE